MNLLKNIKNKLSLEDFILINKSLDSQGQSELIDIIKSPLEYNKDDFKFYRYSKVEATSQELFPIVENWYSSQEDNLDFFELIVLLLDTFNNKNIKFQFLKGFDKNYKKGSLQIDDKICMTYFYKIGYKKDIQNLMAFALLKKLEKKTLTIVGLFEGLKQKKQIEQELAQKKLEPVNYLSMILFKKKFKKDFQFKESLKINQKYQDVIDKEINQNISNERILSQYEQYKKNYNKLLQTIIGYQISTSTQKSKEKITIKFSIRMLKLKYLLEFSNEQEIFMDGFYLLFTQKVFPKLFKRITFAFSTKQIYQKKIQFIFDEELLQEAFFQNVEIKEFQILSKKYLINATVDNSMLYNPSLNNKNLLIQLQNLFDKDKKQLQIEIQFLEENFYQIDVIIISIFLQKKTMDKITFKVLSIDYQTAINFCLIKIIANHFPSNLQQIFLRYTFTQNLKIFEQYLIKNIYPQHDFKIMKYEETPDLFDFYCRNLNQIQILKNQKNFFDFHFFVNQMRKIQIQIKSSSEKYQFQWLKIYYKQELIFHCQTIKGSKSFLQYSCFQFLKNNLPKLLQNYLIYNKQFFM